MRFWNTETDGSSKRSMAPALRESSFRSNLVGFDPEGATFVSAQGDGDWKIRLWELATGKVLRDFELARCPRTARCRASGSMTG